MRKWAEVYVEDKLGDITGRKQVAALDVTDEPDGGSSVMADLKSAYGSDATYQWHYCYHDEGKSCRTENIK